VETRGGSSPPFGASEADREIPDGMVGSFLPRQEPDRLPEESYVKTVARFLSDPDLAGLPGGGVDGLLGGFQPIIVSAGGDRL
jgi:hypothetical protein